VRRSSIERISGGGRIDCWRDGWSDVVEGGWNIGGDFGGGLLHYRRHVGQALTRLEKYA